MLSLNIPIAEDHKMITHIYNHVDPNILNIINCNVINLMLFAELLPQGVVMLRGSYDLALCYSSRTKSGELGCVLQQLHKRFEESIDINIDSDITEQNLQPVVFVKDNPICSSIIKGTMVDTTVQMDIGIKLYNKTGDTDLSASVDENNGEDNIISERKPEKKLIIKFDSEGKNQNDIEEPPVNELESSSPESISSVNYIPDMGKQTTQIKVSELNKLARTEQETKKNNKVKSKTRSCKNKGKKIINTNEFDTVIDFLINKGKENISGKRNTGFAAFGGENNIVRGRTRSKSR
ncbi:hypothetical protein [Desulfolucanica intricata]|uniref:hypothetical protein n=1 Tax=Desulfolucanica intricata TaxID=1285191 RepID=UPI00082E80A7|nr:hypothetical protein [Desulfolucanica intricata]